MPSSFNYGQGLGKVASYQASARPFLTSSLTVPVSSATPLIVSFNQVSRFVVVTNTLSTTDPSSPLRFGFSEAGVKGTINNNFAVLDNGESFEGEFRVVKVFLLSNTAAESSASVVAGLTNIPHGHLQANWSGSQGVG